MSKEPQAAQVPAISPALLEALKRIDTCAVANAIESFEVRLRNEGYADASIAKRCPAADAMVGHAVTLQIRCSSPPPTGGVYPDPTEWWKHLLALPAPRVLVIQDMDEHPGTGAYLGAVHASVLSALGCVGVITNGAVRDLPGLSVSGLQVFSKSVSPSHGYAHVVGYGAVVQVGGMTIRPGDLLHADEHGILSIPFNILDQLLARVVMIADREKRIIELCRAAGPDAEALRGAVRDHF